MLDIECLKKALDLEERAKACLEKTAQYVKDRIIKSDDGKWGLDKYLDGLGGEPSHRGLFGTSCAISTLVECGEHGKSDWLQNCASSLLSDDFRADLGWTTNRLKEKANTLIVNGSCYALSALFSIGQDPRSPEIRPALRRLLDCRHPSGAWGHYPDDTIDRLTATCNAIMTLAKATKLRSDIVEPNHLRGAIDWVLRQQDPQSGGWPRSTPSAGSTAMALLALQEASGTREAVSKGAHYLVRDTASWNPTRERFRIVVPGMPALDEEYSQYTPATSVSALLSANLHPCSPEVLQGTETLIMMNEHCGGCWRNPEDLVVAWEIMYGSRALRAFVTAMDCHLWEISSAGTLSDLPVWQQGVNTKLEQLLDRLNNDDDRTRNADSWKESVDSSLQSLRADVESLRQREWRNRLRRLVRSRCFPLIAMVAFILIYIPVYLFWLGPQVMPNTKPLYALIAGSLLAIVFGFLGLWLNLRETADPPKPN